MVCVAGVCLIVGLVVACLGDFLGCTLCLRWLRFCGIVLFAVCGLDWLGWFGDVL